MVVMVVMVTTTTTTTTMMMMMMMMMTTMMMMMTMMMVTHRGEENIGVAHRHRLALDAVQPNKQVVSTTTMMMLLLIMMMMMMMMLLLMMMMMTVTHRGEQDIGVAHRHRLALDAVELEQQGAGTRVAHQTHARPPVHVPRLPIHKM
jgi:hypothetical protein